MLSVTYCLNFVSKILSVSYCLNSVFKMLSLGLKLQHSWGVGVYWKAFGKFIELKSWDFLRRPKNCFGRKRIINHHDAHLRSLCTAAEKNVTPNVLS